jgi:phosphoribosylformylglycinamidine synthase subunit PurQ / glutaminase
MSSLIRIGVVVFPGSNCDQDMIDALSVYPEVKVSRLWHKDHDLLQSDLVVLPGGFSFGDYLRSGAIARFSPIMHEVMAFARKGGFVFGVCNGFQVLCESGLLPGALLHNQTNKFICRNTFIKPEPNESAITAKLEPGKALKIPIAHGEGRYFAHDETMKLIRDQQQVIFRYCGPDGEQGETFNPNGALDNIAGISNQARNVFGMMPHPERAADALLGNTDGRLIIDGFLQSLFGISPVLPAKDSHMVST